jgi:hypothetical protein
MYKFSYVCVCVCVSDRGLILPCTGFKREMEHLSKLSIHAYYNIVY